MDPGLRLADWAGRRIHIVIDRPLGSRHPREPDLIYEVNYGYVPGTMAPDGHPIDVYVLGADEALDTVEATVIAVIRRRDDVEDKLVAAVAGTWSSGAIIEATHFQEQWFDSFVEVA